MAEFCAYSEDMNQIIACRDCGKEIAYGEAFTSRKHFNQGGFGFCVCESCYEKEWEEYREQHKA